MWGFKIVEGKDHQKKADRTWAFPSKYEIMGYSKTINLLLDMTKPIHRTGKVVMGNRGFCVAMGVMALQKFGIHGHPNQEAGVLPKYDPSNYIDGYTMATKPLGHTEMFVQVMEGQGFLVHCTKDHDYTTKIMSTHGVLDEI